MPRLALILCATLLAGCAGMTIPAKGVTGKGRVLHGEIKSSLTLSGGTLVLSDNKISCSAPLDGFESKPTIIIKATCSDGRMAYGRISRSAAAYSLILAGDGELNFADGERVIIAWGKGV